MYLQQRAAIKQKIAPEDHYAPSRNQRIIAKTGRAVGPAKAEARQRFTGVGRLTTFHPSTRLTLAQGRPFTSHVSHSVSSPLRLCVRFLFCVFCSLPALVRRQPDDRWPFRGYS